MNASGGKKILFLVAVDWYFCLHWLPLARAVKAAGYDVAVITATTEAELSRQIKDAGLRLYTIPLSRTGMRLREEWRSLQAIFAILRKERPALVHAIAQKPVLYVGLAARLGRVPAFVATIPGFGYAFTSKRRQARFLKAAFGMAYRWLLTVPEARVTVQNPDDQARFRDSVGGAAVLIRGVGVDLARFRPHTAPAGAITVVLASRMIWEKGLEEFVHAAVRLRDGKNDVRCVVVGKPDTSNPSAIPAQQLQQWHDSGVVEWWGYCRDMAAVLASAHIVCLPTYYSEGLPTILIEAAAAGLPLVATDVPGCREVVRPGVNGALVPGRDAAALADAIEGLVGDAALRDRYGRASRRLAEEEFGIERVASETLEVYRSLLDMNQ